MITVGINVAPVEFRQAAGDQNKYFLFSAVVSRPHARACARSGRAWEIFLYILYILFYSNIYKV